MKITVVGFFGYFTNQLDGQTVKTRDVYKLIRKKSEEDVDFFDTQSFKESKLNILSFLKKIIQANVIIYLPAQSNLKYIFPFIFIITKLLRIKLNYLVVGGWLYGFLKNKPIHRYMLARISGIYTETENLKQDLKKYGFKNVDKLHNFRAFKDPILNCKVHNSTEIKLVFMARVQVMKGVEVLFSLDKKLKEKNMTNVTIDIFGPVTKEYEQQFLGEISNSNITYKGVLEPDKIYKTLSDYDLMLFPTKYYTEGFPGSILDAYISGVPVIVTKWLNAEEFVIEGKSGHIVEFDNEEAFINKVLQIVNSKNNLATLKENVKEESGKYDSDAAWRILKDAI